MGELMLQNREPLATGSFWSAPAERSGDGALASPPHETSKAVSRLPPL
jgi:hypothetical protein